ncbi:MAG: hypothetical protein RLY16_2188 [Bacteroidota bacterium]|jgi:sterol desaturase/sphingolipid hydroxylase (fatty acid hydroxylase superfamily)
MKFFARVVMICNLCFIVSVIMRLIEIKQHQDEKFNDVVLLKPVQSTIVVLGYGAIVINVLFCLLFLISAIIPKWKYQPNWMTWANLFFLCLQIYYFFFSTW